ncbi:MAG: metal-sensitive transcriptional regulator [Chloroflexota bacterium]
MDAESREDALRRLSYIDGHISGVRKMIENDRYCVDILKQTFAIRRAIESLESMLLEGHLHSCVVEGVQGGREEQVLQELMELYQLANR